MTDSAGLRVMLGGGEATIMSRLDDLPPDQRAALSLLLRQGKVYAEVATMLQIGERAVHDRAHAALAVLAPREARELTPERREEIGDYLLGQSGGVARRLRARRLLDDSPAAQAWARAVAGELAPLASGPLPEIPDGAGPSRLRGGVHDRRLRRLQRPARHRNQTAHADPAESRQQSGRGGSGAAGRQRVRLLLGRRTAAAVEGLLLRRVAVQLPHQLRGA